MVKLTGPLGSAKATGAFGGTAVFSSWKGRSYAKTKTTPFNPNSPMQVSVRATMAFLASQWSVLSDAAKATWTAAAAAAQIPPYNQFISANLGRWSELHAPSQRDPPTETGTLPELDTFWLKGGPAHVEISVDWYNRYDAWGLVIFRSTSSGFAPALNNAIALVPLTADTGLIYNDQGLAPARYYYNFRSFTTLGKLSAKLGQQTAVAT